MLHRTYTPTLLMGQGEWLGQCLRRLSQADDDLPIDVTEVPADWRFDWEHHTEPGTPARSGRWGRRFD